MPERKRPEKKHEKNMKKNFGGLENGCIFAPAFDRGAHLWEGRPREAKGHWKNAEDEIACVGGQSETLAETRDESKVEKQAILTMKSLILAQDER